ncbi:TPA_asm: hypothetical protein [Anelosimus tangle-web spider MELD virus]|nr:TPA_asm: hypothetical protein [Anelosimus tangle-web spider MELD virus]
MKSQRSAVNELYNNPVFKNQFWEDTAVFNEYTPLLASNIKNVLEKYCQHSKVYENIYEYIHKCYNKDFPQVVGLEGNSLHHWLVIQKVNDNYVFHDSSGCPKAMYYKDTNYRLPPIESVIAADEGHIRQSSQANSCGLYALTYCLGSELENNPYTYWEAYAPKVLQYEISEDDEINLHLFAYYYFNEETDFYLYSNDLNIFNFYKKLDGHD